MYSTACQLEGDTPIEALTGIKPDVSNLRVFGCTAYVNIPRQLRGNTFANQARKGIIVGYIGGAYRVLIPEKSSIMVSQDVRTLENTIKRELEEKNVVLNE